MRAWIFAAALLTGCMTEDAFPKKAAAAQCKTMEACAAAQFEATFTSQKDCTERLTDDFEGVAALAGAFCEFDKKKAAECVSNSAKAAKTCSSSDINDADLACAAAYDCRGVSGFDSGL